MKPEFITERSGKAFVLYAGLLDQATEDGLRSITTEIVQIPTKDNEQMAVVVAKVVMQDGNAGRIYTGIGDANPRNVAPAMVNCLLRLAETRAKARALRDAINVSMCSAEETDTPEPVRDVTLTARRPARPNAAAAGCTCKATGKFHALNCPARSTAAA